MALRGKRSELSIVTWTLIELIAVVMSMLLMLSYVQWKFADDKFIVEFLVKDISLCASSLAYMQDGSYINYYEPRLINLNSPGYEIKIANGIISLTKEGFYTFDWPYSGNGKFIKLEEEKVLYFRSYITLPTFLIKTSNGGVVDFKQPD